MSWRSASLLLTLTTLLASGCVTSTSIVHLDPMQTRYPVSASGQYLDSRGQVVKPGEYRSLRSFKLDRSVDVPAGTTAAVPLDIQADLDRLVDSTGGDAVTNVTLQATSFVPEGHASVALWQSLGTLGLVFGGPFALVGGAAIATDPQLRHDSQMIAMGAVGTAVAALGVAALLTASHRRSTTPNHWNVHIEGDVVQRNSAEPSAASAAASAPPSAGRMAEPVPSSPTSGSK